MAAYAGEDACDRPGAKPFYRPCRDGHLFYTHFPALRTGLLSNVPAGPVLRIPLALMLTRLAAAGTLPKNPIILPLRLGVLG